MSLGESILSKYAANRLTPEPVRVFDSDLFIQHWSARQRAIWEGLVFDREGQAKAEVKSETFMAATVVCSLVDADCKPIFTPEQLQAVAELSVTELDKAYQVAVKVNQLDKDQIEDARKNSAPGLSSALPSA